MRKILATALIMALLAAFFTGAVKNASAYSVAGSQISIEVDGRIIFPDVPPYFQNGRTMVPFRFIAEALGCNVNWDDEYGSVKAEENGQAVYLYIGETIMYVNGIEKKIDVPAALKDGRTFVPLRSLSEAMGFSVAWNQDTQTVMIKTSSPGVKYVTSPEEAASIVERMPEVKELFLTSAPGTIRLELNDEEAGRYIFHVFEIVKDDEVSHTATYGWFAVDKETGRAYSIIP